MNDLFTLEDLGRFGDKGISEELIQVQLENFRTGFPPISLHAAATVGDGIMRLSEVHSRAYAEKYQAVQQDLSTIKFVPASGAASRMFKSLFEYLNQEEGEEKEANAEVLEFVGRLGEMALEKDLEDALWQRGLDLGRLKAEGDIREIIKAVIEGGGLNYGQLPKGLIKFHRYEKELRTPVEEHLVEGAEYCKGENHEVHLHFTISPEHRDLFAGLVNEVKASYEKRLGAKFITDFSLQHAYTDTIAVDPDNKPFRDAEGRILFRPGGHGALLANLNDLDADLIFIKNIDNVAPDRMKPVTYLYKKALAGILVEYRARIHAYIMELDKEDYRNLPEIESFLENTLCYRFPEGDKKYEGRRKADLLRRALNRPVRVCGMVKNEGEPGGGPFWTRNRDGSVSLQIVESAQIDFGNKQQAEIAGSATHFNPVDLVCATRDYKGNPFTLNDFIDPDTGLISSKSQDGRSLKAQELPGLWNGSMADWNTVFVEVPIETFNPVKTINDLLRPEHLA